MTHRTILAVLLVIVSIGLLAYFVSPQADEVSDSEPRPDGVAAERAAPAIELEDGSTELSPEPAAAIERASAATAPPEERGVIVSPEEGVEVRVVLAWSGAPVAGARVRGLGLLELREESDANAQLPVGVLDPEAELGNTPVYVTDATGTTRVPRRSLPADYSASAGALWGKAYCSDNVEPPITIELVPDATFRVRVVDARGKPRAGQEVALGCCGAPRESAWQVLTDAMGFVEVRHWAAAAQKCFAAKDACLYPVLFANEDQLPCVWCDPQVGGPAPAELALPPLGRVEVRARTPEGVELAPLGIVLSHPAAEGWSGQPHRDADVFHPDRIEGRCAVFEDVGLGIEVRASSRELGFGTVHVVGVGPAIEGETARIELVVERPMPVLTGRLLDPAGRALRSAEAELLPVFRGEHTRHVGATPFRTNDAGEFAVPLRHAIEASASLIADQVAFAWVDAAGIRHKTRPRLPEFLALPASDLGDVRFPVYRSIAQGLVVNEAGHPFPDPGWSVVIEPVGETGTRATADHHVRSGADGTFEVFSSSEVRSWRATARADGYEASDPVAFGAGARDVRVRFGLGGTIEGRLVFDAGVSFDQVTVRVTRDDEPPSPSSIVFCPLAENGRFHFGANRPGWFTIAVERRGKTLIRLPGLELDFGRPCVDPRLALIRVAPSGDGG